MYLALPSINISKKRVAERVSHGGHSIPIKDIERRFSRSLYNLLIDFSVIADTCICFMNNTKNPKLIFEQKGANRNIINNDLYQLILQGAGL